MKQVGFTKNGEMVVSGLAKLYFQEGIPLAIIFMHCIDKGIQPSFYHLYIELKESGMTHDRIRHLLNENIFEVYGKEYRDECLIRIDKLTLK